VPATPSTPSVTPSAPTPSVSPTPAPTPPASSSSGSSGGGSQTSGGGGSQTSGGGSQTSGGGSQTSTGGQTTTPAPAAPVAIDLGASAASVYDPYSRATAVGAPAKAIDGDGSTSWFVETAPGQTTVGAGLVVSLGSLRGTKAIDITTPTPGFKVEIYETDETTPPPAITDTRWAHITDKENVGEGGKTHIVLGGGSSKYATLLVWITKPPSDGTRVRIAELKVFG
jgi:hypothetical protein